MSKISQILPSEKEQQKQINLSPNDKRYYYIRVKDIKKISPQLTQNRTPLTLIFQISTRKSQTTFKTDFMTHTTIDAEQRKRLREEAHFFCFEAQEILVLKLRAQKVKKTKGYSNILLTPFMALPHTCHSITVNMVFQELDKNVIKQISAVVQIDLYFFLDFKAELQISPLDAHIFHNTSSFGLMNPCIIMTINGQRKKSMVVDQGGIHPNWQKYSDKKKKEMIEGGVKAESLADNEQINNCFNFSLTSVGHDFKIEIISYPLFGEDVILVGSTTLRLESLGYFKNPNCVQQYQSIKLKYLDPQTKTTKDGGQLSVKTRFIFDIVKLRKQVSSDSESDNQNQG